VERFDAIVVGAGPAGSTAAIRLARAGARVLLADKARFPRDKPCGGGLTMRAVRELPVDPQPVVEHVVDRMAFRLRYGRSFERGRGKPLILMTQRRRLDHFLAEQAAAAGADFRDGVKVAAVEVDDAGVRATVEGAPVEAQVLVGADGANGIVARTLGLGGEPTYGVAFEGNVRYGAADEDRFRGLALIELGTVPGGYGWVFPKGDHVNVGVGGWEHVGPTLRDRLDDLCARHGIDRQDVESLRGHRLPLRRPGSALARGRALVVGDAAGLVDPISGDGMYEAFVSARLAAQAIEDLLNSRAGDLEPYARATIEELGPNAAASWSAKVALDRFPRVAFVVVPLAWPTVARLVRGEIDRPGQARRLARAPLRVLKRLAIQAGDRGEAFRSALPQS
jgi:geranylgeranyl reductase family protein